MRRMENILGAQVAVLLTAGLLSFSHAQTLHTSPHGEGLRGLAPAMRVATPKIRWQLTLPAGIAHGSITFSNNGQYLYFKTFGDKQGQVFKVEASTGNIVWQTNPTTIGFGRFSYSGVVVDEQNGRLYTTGTPSSTPYNQSIVAALDINTGAIIWVKTASDLGLSGRNLGTGNLLLHPNRTRLYVRDDNNPDRIVALDASNGNRIWTYNMPNNFDSDSWMLHRTLGPIWTDPVSGRVRIAFVNNSTVGSVGAIQDNGNSASLAWSANVAQSMEYHWWGNGNLSLDNQTLYVASFSDGGNPVLTALDTSNGAIRWRVFRTEQNGMSQYQNPAIGADGTIYSVGRGIADVPQSPIMGGRAATGERADYWNSFARNRSFSSPWRMENLLAHEESPTGIGIRSNAWDSADFGFPVLMGDSHYFDGSGGSITLFNVPPGEYEVYVYAYYPTANVYCCYYDYYCCDYGEYGCIRECRYCVQYCEVPVNRRWVFTIGQQSREIQDDRTFFGGYELGRNYVRFESVSPSGTGDITISIVGNTSRVDVNGIQLVARSGALAGKRINVDFDRLYTSPVRQIVGAVTAVNPDGTIKWQFKNLNCDEFTGWPVAIMNGVVYAVDQIDFASVYLYAIKDNGTEGVPLWRFQLDYSYFGNVSPSVGPDGTLYVASARDNADNQILFALMPVQEGDVDTNGCVDDADLLQVLFAFGQSGTGLPEDLNGDSTVDDADLLLVLFNFGSGC
jgi:outer membrane protein assembly factor BamB